MKRNGLEAFAATLTADPAPQARRRRRVPDGPRGHRQDVRAPEGGLMSCTDADSFTPLGGEDRADDGTARRSRSKLAYAGDADAVEAEVAWGARRARGAAVERAVSMLAVSAGQAGEVAVDAELSSAPAGPAAAVYTGVLYDRLRLPELPKRAQGRVLIASALWGVLRPADRDPLLPVLGESEAGRDRRPRRLLAPGARRGAPRQGGDPGRRHALRRLLGGLEAEAGDAGQRARVQRGEGQAQTGEPHGEGDARRSRAGAAGGEEGRPSLPRARQQSPSPRASPSS